MRYESCNHDRREFSLINTSSHFQKSFLFRLVHEMRQAAGCGCLGHRNVVVQKYFCIELYGTLLQRENHKGMTGRRQRGERQRD